MLYTLQPLRKRAAEVLERHDVIAVLEARPAHNEAESFHVAAPAAEHFGSRSRC